VAPADFAAALAWSASTVPRQRTAVQFRWRYRDERARYAGRGVARVAPPDSLRFDFRGPFGYSGAAAIVGDSVLWAQPPEDFSALVRGLPLLWAALGTVRPPAGDMDVYGERRADAAVWRFVARGRGDTLDYVARDGGPPVLEAEWRQAGRVRARSRTEYGEHGVPATARIDFPEAKARFEITVVAWDSLATFAPALWHTR